MFSSAAEADITIRTMFDNWGSMKRTLCCILLLTIPGILAAETSIHQEGTIVRMRMTDCVGPQHGFMAAMSGGAKAEQGLQCAEYVLVANQVVYVISGKGSDQLLPLAEVTHFRIQKNEMLIRIDDAAKESHFHIKAMVMRAEWERSQMLEEAEADVMVRRHLDPAVVTREQ